MTALQQGCAKYVMHLDIILIVWGLVTKRIWLIGISTECSDTNVCVNLKICDISSLASSPSSFNLETLVMQTVTYTQTKV